MEKSYNITNKEDVEDLAKIVNIKSDILLESIKRSTTGKEKAYCKYSNFRVGATVVLKDGTIYEGCNVENISYGLSICAERSAICSCLSLGVKFKDFHYIVVTSDREEFISPCGACRQFIAEFEEFKYVICANVKGVCKVITTNEMLPFVFKTEL